jgi:hypothetical protein
MSNRPRRRPTPSRDEGAADPAAITATYEYPDLRDTYFTGPTFVAAEPGSEPRPTSELVARLLSRVERRLYVSGPELADALVASEGRPLPSLLAQYLDAFLRGAIKKQRGSKGRSLIDRAWRDLALSGYQQRKSWLKRRRKRYGGLWQCYRAAPWWSTSPHEIALDLVHRHFYPDMSRAGVRDLLFPTKQRKRSSRQKPPNSAE